MRAAIYARYSSDQQRDASIDDQVRVCRRRIAAEGWSDGPVYTDHAISGASRHRPGYSKLLEDARAGRFDALIAESIDRLSRDQEHVAALFKLLSYHDLPLVTVAEGEISELHIGLKGTMSALYLKDLSQKTKRGLEGRVRAGKSAGGLSYGYEVARSIGADGAPTTGERRIKDEEAEIVRRIFTSFAGGKSPRTIAIELNAEGVSGPAGKTWGPSTIYGNWRRGTGVLNNELYIGRMVWNRQRFVKDPETGKRQARPNPPEEWIVENVPGLRIVDDGVWRSVKTRQEATRRDLTCDGQGVRSERARRSRYLFSGTIKCGVCGGGYSLISKTHYGCANSRNRGTCDNHLTIRRDRLEETVLSGIRESLLHPDLIKEFVEEFRREIERLNTQNRAKEASKRRELAKLERQIRRIVEAVKEGLFVASMKQELVDLEDQKERLSAELDDLDAPEPPTLHPGLSDVYRRKVADLTGALNEDHSRAEAAEAIRMLLQEIRMTPEGDRLSIELVGELAGLLTLSKANGPRDIISRAGSITLVAGAGFEPATFRL